MNAKEMTRETTEIVDPTLKSGFTAMPNCVMTDASLSPGARLTYGLILMHAWRDKARPFPGQARLARLVGVKIDTLRGYLRELRDRRLIAWERRGLGRTNLYQVLPLQEAYPDLASDIRLRKRAEPDTPKTVVSDTPKIGVSDTPKIGSS